MEECLRVAGPFHFLSRALDTIGQPIASVEVLYLQPAIRHLFILEFGSRHHERVAFLAPKKVRAHCHEPFVRAYARHPWQHTTSELRQKKGRTNGAGSHKVRVQDNLKAHQTHPLCPSTSSALGSSSFLRQ
jgi:hypothetical protein